MIWRNQISKNLHRQQLKPAICLIRWKTNTNFGWGHCMESQLFNIHLAGFCLERPFSSSHSASDGEDRWEIISVSVYKRCLSSSSCNSDGVSLKASFLSGKWHANSLLVPLFQYHSCLMRASVYKWLLMIDAFSFISCKLLLPPGQRI